MTASDMGEAGPPPTAAVTRRQLSFRRLWFPVAFVIVGLYAGLPWLAPVLMRLGWRQPAEAIYTVYSTQCHQLSQRSYFLFGPKLMYAADELGIGAGPADFMALRAYRGTEALGWKVAWSDRMAAMYSTLFVSLAAARLLSTRIRPLPVWAFLLLLLPMAIDGGTHFLSDLSGFGQGFRDTNLWLADLTGGRLAAGFYGGDAWGSFNAAMRLATGVLFGLGVAWFAVPRIEASFRAAGEADAASLRRSATRAGLRRRLEAVYNSNVSKVHPAADLPRSGRETPVRAGAPALVAPRASYGANGRRPAGTRRPAAGPRDGGI
jgi:uncharacterized membrane protein